MTDNQIVYEDYDGKRKCIIELYEKTRDGVPVFVPENEESLPLPGIIQLQVNLFRCFKKAVKEL